MRRASTKPLLARLARPGFLVALIVLPLASCAMAQDPHDADAAMVEQWLKDLSNWGRWGDDDQLGTLNLITPEKRLAAAALVSDGVSVSMAHQALTDTTPDNPSPYAHQMTAQGTDNSFPFVSDQISVEQLTLSVLEGHLELLDGVGRLHEGLFGDELLFVEVLLAIELPLCLRELALDSCERCLLLVVLQTQEQLALADRLSFFDEQLGHAARSLRVDLDLALRLEVGRKAQNRFDVAAHQRQRGDGNALVSRQLDRLDIRLFGLTSVRYATTRRHQKRHEQQQNE